MYTTVTVYELALTFSMQFEFLINKIIFVTAYDMYYILSQSFEIKIIV